MPELTPSYFFLSAEIEGDGSPIDVPHTLAKPPERTIAFLTGGPADYVQPIITIGEPDEHDITITVTTGWKFQVLALA
jgi:hypothetical protein